MIHSWQKFQVRGAREVPEIRDGHIILLWRYHNGIH
jgi:hypothetical protein